MQNRITKNIPPIILKIIATEHNIKAIPRYIGFLETLKTPSVTKTDACIGLIGLMVVLFFLKRFAAENKRNNPKIKKIKAIKFECLNSNTGNSSLEKYIARPKIRVTIGGGIFVCILLKPLHS
tara:strand:+ start:986 stop:1354 length:369 start_codon:yes stop_codon:yes gene_type:complete